MVLVTGSSPTRLAGTDRLTRQSDDRVEQIEAPNQTAAPMARLDSRFAEDLLDDVVELAEAREDDETKHCLLQSDAVQQLDVPALSSQTGLYESSADRAVTRFRLRAFSSRGSPSA